MRLLPLPNLIEMFARDLQHIQDEVVVANEGLNRVLILMSLEFDLGL